MAGYRELYMVQRPLSFAGIEASRKPVYSIVGAPFDSTSSYRSGQRFAPAAIREASINIEGNGYAIDGFIDDVPLRDEGDIVVSHGNVHETLTRIAKVITEILEDNATPVVIGGEHTVTLGVLRGIAASGRKPCIISLDAHFDLRDDYLGERYSHACWLRRALEEMGVRAVVVGVRAFDKEELVYAENSGLVTYIPSWVIKSLGLRAALLRIKSALSPCSKVYLTIDMDFLDPAYAPGVGNPEPGGLDIQEGLQLASELAKSFSIIGVDVVEVTPNYDPSGITSIAAAKIMQQVLLASWEARRNKLVINK